MSSLLGPNWQTAIIAGSAPRRMVLPLFPIRAQQARLYTAKSPHLGFRRREMGLLWYPNKEELFQSLRPSPLASSAVLVGSSYERLSGDRPSQARKYSSFHSHEDYWRTIEEHQEDGLLHNLHEVLPYWTARKLYFDLDGEPSYRQAHSKIIKLLTSHVHRFFGGLRAEWSIKDMEPVVLATEDPTKYSAHVVFPRVQFKDHEEQSQYMQLFLGTLSMARVDMPDGRSIPLLEQLVDTVPYMRFQMLRGPHACKLKDGQLVPETRLEPENLYRNDELSTFAGHADPDIRLDLPPPGEILANDEELRHYHLEHKEQLRQSTGPGSGRVSIQDQVALFSPCYVMSHLGGTWDASSCTDVDKFEEALTLLHPRRATDWWSWFRISGVTYTMLVRYEGIPEVQRRIWDAHMKWSSGYEHFDYDENVHMVLDAEGKPKPGLNLLMRLVRFDNPNLIVIEEGHRVLLSQLCPRTPVGGASLSL
mmetsp:Transcript_37133/g.78765  ORF Transcript_37133/g.78765 Transcript_37133/m.78765 type:complete len:477 (-) Transcript_37133:111-1541(-)|eukprot:CAMPEP_0206488828 /NCGR_PEP_ID=MMETSP0324_2-20121206/42704_1 /ASSEMBLY_ACC=CAM_ASM_000836 /TAXON_ID=2866 /ORGANISM="Crypthecodinium cohnii, Strain Seligo" /LENGTH=476 /DNA_ID=CAMNT_0053968045 /DNA_START=259 /DNA_END=1689 /DNA_ORIENTATION=-